jgi:hypothetical protein
MRDVIIDHINQLVRRPQPQRPGNMGSGWYRAGLDPGAGARATQPPGSRFRQQFPMVSGKAELDELTPWISTTANMDWALWYIAKLLSHPGQGHGYGRGRGYDKVKLAVISISTDRTRNKELYVAPFLWRRDNEARYMCQVDKERYNRARKNAVASKEVLFYGRIFPESVLADLTFTREVSLSSPISCESDDEGVNKELILLEPTIRTPISLL